MMVPATTTVDLGGLPEATAAAGWKIEFAFNRTLKDPTGFCDCTCENAVGVFDDNAPCEPYKFAA
jgi:hypothetical protein